MGLDQYAHAKWDGIEEQEQIAYWRKHPSLNAYMEELYYKKNNLGDAPGGLEEVGDGTIIRHTTMDSKFNCDNVELGKEDVDNLAVLIKNNLLPKATGFFWGTEASEEYKEEDLEFIENARKVLDDGGKVIYHCWW